MLYLFIFIAISFLGFFLYKGFQPVKRIQQIGNWSEVISAQSENFKNTFDNFKSNPTNNEHDILFFLLNTINNSKSFYSTEVKSYVEELFIQLNNNNYLKKKMYLKCIFLCNCYKYQEALEVYLQLLEIYENETTLNKQELRKVNLEIAKLMFYKLSLDGSIYLNKVGDYSESEDEINEWETEVYLIKFIFDIQNKEIKEKIDSLIFYNRKNNETLKLKHIYERLIYIYEEKQTYKTLEYIEKCNELFSSTAYLNPNDYIIEYMFFLKKCIVFFQKHKSSLYIQSYFDEFSEIVLNLSKLKTIDKENRLSFLETLLDTSVLRWGTENENLQKELHNKILSNIEFIDESKERNELLGIIYHNLAVFETNGNKCKSLPILKNALQILQTFREKYNSNSKANLEANILMLFANYYASCELDNEKSAFYADEVLKILPTFPEEKLDNALILNNSVINIKYFWSNQKSS